MQAWTRSEGEHSGYCCGTAPSICSSERHNHHPGSVPSSHNLLSHPFLDMQSLPLVIIRVLVMVLLSQLLVCLTFSKALLSTLPPAVTTRQWYSLASGWLCVYGFYPDHDTTTVVGTPPPQRPVQPVIDFRFCSLACCNSLSRWFGLCIFSSLPVPWKVRPSRSRSVQ